MCLTNSTAVQEFRGNGQAPKHHQWSLISCNTIFLQESTDAYTNQNRTSWGSASLSLSLTCLSSPHISVSVFISLNVSLSSAALVFVAESQSQETKGTELIKAWSESEIPGPGLEFRPVGIFGMPLGEEENLHCLYCSLFSSRSMCVCVSHLRIRMEKDGIESDPPCFTSKKSPA